MQDRSPELVTDRFIRKAFEVSRLITRLFQPTEPILASIDGHKRGNVATWFCRPAALSLRSAPPTRGWLREPCITAPE